MGRGRVQSPLSPPARMRSQEPASSASLERTRWTRADPADVLRGCAQFTGWIRDRRGTGRACRCSVKKKGRRRKRQHVWYVADRSDESVKVEERNMARGHWDNLNGPCGQHKAQVPLMGQACLGFSTSPSRAGGV